MLDTTGFRGSGIWGLAGLGIVLLTGALCLVWLHKKVTAHKKAFVTVSRTYEAIVRDRDGEEIQFSGKEDKVDEVLQSLAQRAPHALVGYSEELNRMWLKNRAEVVAAVDARKAQTSAVAVTAAKRYTAQT